MPTDLLTDDGWRPDADGDDGVCVRWIGVIPGVCGASEPLGRGVVVDGLERDEVANTVAGFRWW